MWKYTAENAYSTISLHDCRSDKISIEGNDFIIDFPDGFWITPAHALNSNDRPLRTGPAQLRFKDCEVDNIYIFKETRLFQRTLLTRRVTIDLTELIEEVNKGPYELEFLYEYHSSISALYTCCVWNKNRGIPHECQLDLTVMGSIEYCWNEITDREW